MFGRLYFFFCDFVSVYGCCLTDLEHYFRIESQKSSPFNFIFPEEEVNWCAMNLFRHIT